MKWRHAKRIISDEEQLARYAYVLGNVPAAVADRAYAAAFGRLSPAQRKQIVDSVRSQLPPGTPAETADDSEAFAALMRNLHARLALVTAPGAAALAAAFATSPPIIAFFSTGAGSVVIDRQPPWLQELAGHDAFPIDAGWPGRP